MFLKKGSVDWTMGKLLSMILMIMVVVLVIYGITSGGINPLLEKISGKFDEVLILLNIKDDFGGDPRDCRTLDLTDYHVRGGQDFLDAMSFLRGRKGDGYRLDLFDETEFKSLDICRGQTNCVLNASSNVGDFSWSWGYPQNSVFANQYPKSHKTVARVYQQNPFSKTSNYQTSLRSFNPPRKTTNMNSYLFNDLGDSIEDSLFYWGLRNKTIELSKSDPQDTFDKMYGDLSVFYGYAFDDRINYEHEEHIQTKAGQIFLNWPIQKFDKHNDELMFAVGWNGVWDVYFYPKGDGNYLYPQLLASGKDTSSMLEFFKREFDDANDDRLYYRKVNMSEYREILSWKSNYFLKISKSELISPGSPMEYFLKRGENAIYSIYPEYDSEEKINYFKNSEMDSMRDVKDLKKFIADENKANLRDFSKFKDDLERIFKGETIKILGDDYNFNEIDNHPLISVKGPRGEYFLKLAWPLRGENNFYIFQKDGTGYVGRGDSRDYMLPYGEFLDGYMVTGIYDLMGRNC